MIPNGTVDSVRTESTDLVRENLAVVGPVHHDNGAVQRHSGAGQSSEQRLLNRAASKNRMCAIHGISATPKPDSDKL
jgi:hypothetical protein